MLLSQNLLLGNSVPCIEIVELQENVQQRFMDSIMLPDNA